jgi:hypothetical protein
MKYISKGWKNQIISDSGSPVSHVSSKSSTPRADRTNHRGSRESSVKVESYLLEAMAPPTPLTIATASVQRLVKEEASYHRELQQQEQRIRHLEAKQTPAGEDDDGNQEYILKQEVSPKHLTLFFPFRTISKLSAKNIPLLGSQKILICRL